MRDQISEPKDKTKDANDKAGQPTDLNTLSVGRTVIPAAVAAARIMAQFPKVDIPINTPTTRWLLQGDVSEADRLAVAQEFRRSKPKLLV
ncbi:MAG TPA: hypothetical protein V6D22_25470 [Candidatus Obscuribacterales bacterium]